MTRRPALLLTLLALSGLLIAADEPADPIKKKLTDAKEKYENEMSDFRDKVKENLDKRMDKARAKGKGNKKLVDQIKAEQQAFVTAGEVPKDTPPLLQKKAAAARKALSDAYEAAVSEYIKDKSGKSDAAAAAVEKELELFRKGGGPGDWKALFNGTGLTGWAVDTGNARRWSVEDGVIVGTAKDPNDRSYLMTTADYADCVLSLDFKFATDSVSAGVVVRGISGEKGVGDRADRITHPIIKLTDVKRPREPLGTSFWLKDSELTPPSGKADVKPKDWNTLTVTVVGRKCKADVNGKVVQDLTGRDPVLGGYVYGLSRAKGRIALEANGGTIHFRDLRVRQIIR